jgi:hypothetical protein
VGNPRNGNPKVRSMRPAIYVYREFPKWVTGPNGCPMIVQNSEEERCIRWKRAGNIGREKANAIQRARADNFALELALEIVVLRKRGCSFRGIADALNRQGISSARGQRWGPSQILRLVQRVQNAVATGGNPGNPPENP